MTREERARNLAQILALDASRLAGPVLLTAEAVVPPAVDAVGSTDPNTGRKI